MNTTSESPDTFESVFRLHYQHLCSYAYTLLKDKESSEDVVQELFIKVWEKQKTGLGADKLKFYLFTAVRNNCLTVLKNNNKNSMREIKEGDATEEITLQMDDGITKPNSKALIAQALDQLPPKCKEVFLLSRLSQQTYKQIAETLGISVKTVENQMGKAIRLLKKFAKENGIYMAMLYFIFAETNTLHTIGILFENWLY